MSSDTLTAEMPGFESDSLVGNVVLNRVLWLMI
jgi:hypothetical protein